MRAANEQGLFNVQLFDDVPDPVRAQMAGEVDFLKVRSGETLIERGVASSDAYLVVTGYLLGVMVSHTGREVAVADFGAGSLFGEMAAIDAVPGTLSIQAAAPSLVARVPGRTFVRWIDTQPGVARNLIRMMSQRTQAMAEAVFGLVVHRVEVRVRLMLTRLFMEHRQLFPDGVLDPAPSHSVIAAHVGANREAVSRVLSGLARSGVVRTGRRRIVVLDPEKLRAGL